MNLFRDISNQEIRRGYLTQFRVLHCPLLDLSIRVPQLIIVAKNLSNIIICTDFQSFFAKSFFLTLPNRIKFIRNELGTDRVFKAVLFHLIRSLTSFYSGGSLKMILYSKNSRA